MTIAMKTFINDAGLGNCMNKALILLGFFLTLQSDRVSVSVGMRF